MKFVQVKSKNIDLVYFKDSTIIKSTIYFIIFYFQFATTFSQGLYMPRNVKEAYENESRSKDGKPGKNYFQNRATYNITLEVLPPNRTINGTSEILYTNNSKDTLPTILLRIIQNIHKKGALRSADVNDKNLTDGLIIDELLVNEEKENLNDGRSGTLSIIKLSSALKPNETIKINIKWHYEIAQEGGREGMIDSSTFFVGYFYPRVCVYDDYYGWDETEFNDLQEFYSDFNDYNVTISTPKNYLVWGTGDLKNTEEVLQPVFAEKLNASMQSEKIIHVVTTADLKNKNITAQNTMNTWKFKADNIQDVAYAITDHYVWDASSVVVDNKTKRRTSVQAAFMDTANDFHNMVKWTNYSLQWFSNNLPGVPYPFPKMTIFQGFSDMEFPMLVNGNCSTDSMWTRRISANHEVAHSWFPFYMGINENRYAFMDEGWASFLESIICYSYMPKDTALEIDIEDASDWSYNPHDEVDLPIITSSNMLVGAAYQLNAYTKPNLAYKALKDLLGDELFKKCLLAYMERWNGKHPIPWDFFNTFNNVSKKDLDYFWKAWFFENNYVDFSIENFRNTKGACTIEFKNIGGALAPFDIDIEYIDGSIATMHQSQAICEANQKIFILNIKCKQKVKSVNIKNGNFVDADESNNFK